MEQRKKTGLNKVSWWDGIGVHGFHGFLNPFNQHLTS